MRYRRHIYSLLFILIAVCVTGAVFSFHLSSKYTLMSRNPEYMAISSKIENLHELEKLRAIALQLHQNTIEDAEYDSSTLHNVFEVLLTLSLVLLLILYFYYRDNVSGNSSDLGSADDAPR